MVCGLFKILDFRQISGLIHKGLDFRRRSFCLTANVFCADFPKSRDSPLLQLLKMNVSKKSLTKKAAALVFAIAGLCSSPLFGQSDATLLNMLVENGTLTQQEAADIKKLSSQTPVCKPTDISSIRISAKFQTQYEFIDTDCDDSVNAGTSDAK